MGMANEDMNGQWRRIKLAHELIAEFTDPGSGVEDEDMIARPDLDA
jgi:hypothetical protein